MYERDDRSLRVYCSPTSSRTRFTFSAHRGHLVTFKRCPNIGTGSVKEVWVCRWPTGTIGRACAVRQRPSFRTWDGRAAGPARHMEHSCGAYVEVLSSRPSSLCERSACTPSVVSSSIPPCVCACSSGQHQAAIYSRRCPTINSGPVPCF